MRWVHQLHLFGKCIDLNGVRHELFTINNSQRGGMGAVLSPDVYVEVLKKKNTRYEGHI